MKQVVISFASHPALYDIMDYTWPNPGIFNLAEDMPISEWEAQLAAMDPAERRRRADVWHEDRDYENDPWQFALNYIFRCTNDDEWNIA